MTMNRHHYEEYNEMLRKADQAMRDILLKAGDEGFPDSSCDKNFMFYVTVKSIHKLFARIQKALDEALNIDYR